MFTVTVAITFWGLEENEPLTIALFLPILSRRNWTEPWKIKKSYWAYLTTRDVYLECKREQEHPVPVRMEGKLRKVSEEASEIIGDVLWIFLLRARAIPSMSDDVVRRLLHRGSRG